MNGIRALSTYVWLVWPAFADCVSSCCFGCACRVSTGKPCLALAVESFAKARHRSMAAAHAEWLTAREAEARALEQQHHLRCAKQALFQLRTVHWKHLDEGARAEPEEYFARRVVSAN